ncbi:conserved domain protein [Verrucomicrobiia bacterium DG1235]|nr:conserved domain protein [Verrucomicrobiae bacterium DG1235]
MKKFLLTKALLILGFAANLPAQGDTWTNLFKDALHEDFYFDFLEEAEPEDVFEFKDDGILLIKGKDQPEGYIQTLDEYSNYEIELEWRWPDEPGNSGIQIHSTSDTSFSIWPECIEIQIESENIGDFWLKNTDIEVAEEQMPNKAADRNRRLKLKREKKFGEDWKKELENKAGQWNQMRIIAEEDTIKVYLNSELVNEGTSVSRTSGYITFQAEESNIEFRNVRIRELD